MQSLADPYSAVEGHTEAQARRKIPLMPSFPVGMLLIPVVLCAAVLCAVIASSAIERWYAVRYIYRGTLDVDSLIDSDLRWTTYSGYFAIASGTAVLLLTLWSAFASANARRLLAVPRSIPPQTSRILVGSAFLGTALVSPGLMDRLDASHIIAVVLALIGLVILPAPFGHLTRIANMSTVVIAPFRRWRGLSSLAFICWFASHLLVRQRWALDNLADELSPGALLYVSAQRKAAALPPITLSPTAATIDPIAAGLDPAVAATSTTLAQLAPGTPVGAVVAPGLDATGAAIAPSLDAAGRVIDPVLQGAPPAGLVGATWQTIEQRLLLDAVLMGLAALAMAGAAASIIVGVWSLDRRHRNFAGNGYTIREAKALV
jgi:hypothetical protein